MAGVENSSFARSLSVVNGRGLVSVPRPDFFLFFNSIFSLCGVEAFTRKIFITVSRFDNLALGVFTFCLVRSFRWLKSSLFLGLVRSSLACL